MASQREANVAEVEAPAPELVPRRPFSDEALLLTDAPVPRRIAPPAGAELETEVVTDWSRLEALEQEWQDLATAATDTNPFYEPWMLLPALRAYSAGARVEMLVASAKGDRGRRVLCGLFPISWRRGRCAASSITSSGAPAWPGWTTCRARERSTCTWSTS